MAITTISAFKTHAGITGTAEDAFLTQLLPQCEAALVRYLGRTIEQTTLTEYYCGTGTQVFWLRQTPVQSITSLYLDSGGYWGQASSPFAADTLLTGGMDYALATDQPTGNIASLSGAVHKLAGYWPRVSRASSDLLLSSPQPGQGNIKVTYVAGWASVPADIVLAVHQMLGQLRSQRSQGGPLQSESLDYWSASYLSADAVATSLGSVQWLVAPYKRLVV